LNGEAGVATIVSSTWKGPELAALQLQYLNLMSTDRLPIRPGEWSLHLSRSCHEN